MQDGEFQIFRNDESEMESPTDPFEIYATAVHRKRANNNSNHFSFHEKYGKLWAVVVTFSVDPFWKGRRILFLDPWEGGEGEAFVFEEGVGKRRPLPSPTYAESAQDRRGKEGHTAYTGSKGSFPS